MSSTASPIRFLTNYQGGGIGDFGAALGNHLAARLGKLSVVETSIDGRGFLRQSFETATYPGQVIANVGLTAWGTSGIRNFSGFASIGFHASRGSPTLAFVHHAIEILNAQETGFPVPDVVYWGAHKALQQVRHCDLVVFSPRLRDLLQSGYGTKPVWLVPLPGNPRRSPPAPPSDSPPKIISAGYWAPYKGIDLFLETVAQLGLSADAWLIGRPHRLLTRDPTFGRKVDQWRVRAGQLNVHLPGFVGPEELDSILSDRSIGILPYTSASGASASFQMFAERGVPVVASDLPEFQYLKDCGAGILLAQPTVENFTDVLGNLLKDPVVWSQLVAKQVAFAYRYSWDSFIEELVARYRLEPNGAAWTPGPKEGRSKRGSPS
ncbi:MAG: glycosyltransferase [Thermoplasmata archaeon]